jgi:hypothetical protein
VNRPPRRAGGLLILLFAMALLSACSVPAAATPAPSGTDSLTQQQEAGGITVKVTWQPEAAAPTFEVTLDTHSIDVNDYDLAELALLRTEAGDLQPEPWTAPEGEHHRSGTLVFPPTESRVLELVIRDLGDVPERTFRWTR